MVRNHASALACNKRPRATDRLTVELDVQTQCESHSQRLDEKRISTTHSFVHG